jgi:CUB/sushi domain-containing protein
VFRAACPYGAGTFTAQTGTITIPSAGGNYAISVTCEYRITTGAPIYLRFDSFATELYYDFVEVYDGRSSSGTFKGKFSGTVIPAIQTATSGSMFIRFTSDSGNVAAGVSMTWLDAMPATLSPTSSPMFDGIDPKCCVWMWTLLCI